MWVMTMFDLPVDTPKQRRAYYRFRKILLKWGYEALQKSVYVKYCASEDYCSTVRKMLANAIPAEGQINAFTFTDLEFERQDFFRGGERIASPNKPARMEFF